MFLGAHIAHRNQLREIIADATASADQQVLDLNAPMLDKVEKLVGELQGEATHEGEPHQ
ncbi:hypothetical protein [Mycobacteroides abscessus]|uniref:hypothetical protein n=1 Tax=Mycobacteroides abscessus TaxID=36809 RepID=UPI001F389F11|nr:hypothetical protein [Mycobacteroides abscessus]